MRLTPFVCLFVAFLPSIVSAHISPTRLEVNLGILPVDVYNNTLNNTSPPIIPTNICPATSTVRSCFQSFLSNYHAQGVTGVRFQFALGNGNWTADKGVTFHSSYSTPFSSTGAVNSAWVTNLGNFFADLKANGITNVTPTSTMAYYWSAFGNSTFSTTGTGTYMGAGCPSGTEPLVFFKWLPFGLKPASGSDPNLQGPADSGNNQAYNCSPKNPTFWGWTPYMNLVNQIGVTAKSAGVTIAEFDIESEIDIQQTTVWARLLYDNTTTTPVRTNVSQQLVNAGQQALATFSVASARGATPADFDCNSAYGDSAHFLHASELLSAWGGQVGIGLPSGSPTFNGEMLCGGSTTGLPIVPSQGAPSITDVHVTPCNVLSTGGCNTNDSQANLVAVAKTMYSDWWNFILNRHQTLFAAFIGETDSNATTTSCNDDTQAMTSDNVSGYLASTLFTNFQTHVVMRPWEWVTSVSPELCQTPANIGAPNGPYAQ